MPLDIVTRLEALESSTASLLRSLEDLDNDEVRAASLLPGWSRGHVLTHLARNADAMVNLVSWAHSGTETPMYASRDKRDADITSGAVRSAAALRADVRESHEQLLRAMAELSDEQWATSIRWGRARPLVRRGRFRRCAVLRWRSTTSTSTSRTRSPTYPKTSSSTCSPR
ncbi:MAG: maleylpyruvate isomerase N-terminal domain-containing protein [Nocardioidaceae bacterium]